jgi:internalin A
MMKSAAFQDWAQLLPPGSLRAGAQESQLASAEAVLGRSLPPQWRHIYACHDGETGSQGVLSGLTWLPLAEMVKQWRAWMELLPEYEDEGEHYSVPPGFIQECYIQAGWIPFAHDHSGNHLGIDLAPGPKGQSGQIINFGRDQEIKHVVAPSVEAFWSLLLQDRQAGRCRDLLAAPAAQPNCQLDLTAWKAGLSSSWQELIDDPESWVASREFYLMRCNLSDLEGLRPCTGLVELSFAVNHVRDLSPLAGLTALRRITANHNPLEDLGPLAGLSQLRDLNLDQTLVSRLRPLRSLQNLQKLSLSSTQVQEITDLPESIQVLSVPASLADWGGLSRLPRLKSLSLVGMQSGLEKLKGLRELSVDVRPTDDLSPLARLSKLTSLRLKGAHQADFLSGMTSLRELHLDHCRLPNLDGLRGRKHFTRLSAYESPVEDLSGLAECPALKYVSASFEQFMALKDRVKADYSSLTGELTDEQSDIWQTYLDAQRR